MTNQSKMQKRRMASNTTTSLILQITVLISNFILPRLILKEYGSEVNGLINSITQFLSIISFLELGIGAVLQSSLYKPLAEQDYSKTSEIVTSASRFFKRLGIIFAVYVILLIWFYPQIANSNFEWAYSAFLILAMSLSSFAQYYYGIVDRLLVTADQRGYIYYTVQTITLILNISVCVFLIHLGKSIQIVKLVTSLIYLARPIILRIYVTKHYSINRKIRYQEEPIKQKWNGIAQHVAAVVLDSTDSIVLTVFASLSAVSVYSVYHLVVTGVMILFQSLTNGIHSLIGNLWAKQEYKQLEFIFGWFEWLVHVGSTFLFGCTGVLIIPFIQIYTGGITDINYVYPVFSFFIVFAYTWRSLRLPYNIMILAAGHFKQTQSNYIIAAIMNIVISIATVRLWGLVGVAIGTLAAMVYQTVWMAYYNSRCLLQWPFHNFCKQLAADCLTAVPAALVCSRFSLVSNSYVEWVLLAIPVALVWGFSALIVNLLLYKNRVAQLLVQSKKALFHR